MNSSLANLLSRRELVRELVAAELKSSTADTRLGWLWWLIDPLLMMLIYWALVVALLGRGRALYAPYWIFVFFGLLTWKHVSGSLAQSTSVLKRRQALIKAVPFPTMALPLSHVLAGFVFFLFGFAILLAMCAFAPPRPHSGELLPLVQLPALMAFQLLIVAALSLPLASLGAIYRDLDGLVPHALRAGFYLFPGLYGADLVLRACRESLGPELASVAFFVYMLNPFAVVVTGYRASLFYGEYLAPLHWGVLALETVVLLGVGWTIFQRHERRIIKFV